MNTHPKERGQALIMIAFAAVGLFAFTALAIDGGAAFSKKRQAQNAADAASLAGALALTGRRTRLPAIPLHWQQQMQAQRETTLTTTGRQMS
jgi:Flp pilus assembly protein TadG